MNRLVGGTDLQYKPLGEFPFTGFYFVDRDGDLAHSTIRPRRKLRKALDSRHRGAWTGFLSGLTGRTR